MKYIKLLEIWLHTLFLLLDDVKDLQQNEKYKLIYLEVIYFLINVMKQNAFQFWFQQVL